MDVSVGPTVRAVEPPASKWVFPSAPPGAGAGGGPAGGSAESGGGGRVDLEVVGIGADLEPGTLLAAYRTGVFPMPARKGVMAWWSPDPRGIISLSPSGPGLRVSRSLRKACSRFQIRVDTAFEEVLVACGDRRRPGAWIDKDVKAAYRHLFKLGWVHSVEAWDGDGRLAGGLYGVAIGGLFAGESMFHHQTDASKVALVGLVTLLESAGAPLLDIQWATPHLLSLGAIEVSRARYLELLAAALERPQPPVFGG